MDHDIVIRGGTVVDGSGGAPFAADVAIDGNRISAIGQVTGRGREEIDAAGRFVTPGFVDVHTHYDGQVTWEQTLEPSSGHGVTTVVMGNCGVGFAPARPGDRGMMIELMEGVEDVPLAVMAEGVPFDWESFPDYLDALDRREADIDFAAYIPHSPLRVYAMGKRGADLEPATEADLSEMRRLTREAVAAGACGVSTSRNMFHRFRDGRLAPCIDTAEAELTALAMGLHDAGGGVFQINPDLTRPASDEFALIRRIAETCGRPATFTIASGDSMVSGWRSYLSALAKAEADGLEINGQFFPRPMGVLFGLDLSFHPFSLNPSYAAIADLPLAEKIAAMRDSGFKARLLAEEPVHSNPQFVWLVSQTEQLFRLRDSGDYTPAPDQSLANRAAVLGLSIREMIYSELLEDEGRAILYCPMGVENGRFDIATELFGQPGTILGLGDGGAHYGMICDAAYPTFLLVRYVRGVGGSAKLSMEQAVKMLANDPARALGLCDRGLLRPGYKADVNVIELDSLHLHRPEVTRDLPANGRRLSQRAEGYDATIVSGVVTRRAGTPTGACPGRLVRSPCTAPPQQSC